MKKIKINLLAIIGMMVAVATVAFTQKTTTYNPTDEPIWYYTEMTSAQENDPEKYNPATGQEICPGDKSVVCLISAPLISDENGERPDLTNSEVLSHKF